MFNNNNDNHKKNVFLDISINRQYIGKIIIKLYDQIVPKTAENFRQLCTGQKGFGYKNNQFHRIIPGFIIHGGDITQGNGWGGKSIYGDTFDDENFEVKHNKIGLVSMANRGANTNNSQFFINTIEKCDWLDGKHVVFGEVIQGIQIVKIIQNVEIQNGKPKKIVVISNCGIC